MSKIQLVKTIEADGTWYKVLVDGKSERVCVSKKDAEAAYEKIKEKLIYPVKNEILKEEEI